MLLILDFLLSLLELPNHLVVLLLGLHLELLKLGLSNGQRLTLDFQLSAQSSSENLKFFDLPLKPLLDIKKFLRFHPELFLGLHYIGLQLILFLGYSLCILRAALLLHLQIFMESVDLNPKILFHFAIHVLFFVELNLDSLKLLCQLQQLLLVLAAHVLEVLVHLLNLRFFLSQVDVGSLQHTSLCCKLFLEHLELPLSCLLERVDLFIVQLNLLVGLHFSLRQLVGEFLNGPLLLTARHFKIFGDLGQLNFSLLQLTCGSLQEGCAMC